MLDLTALRIARGLARAHGHTWGGVDLTRLTEFTPESISQACRDQELITKVLNCGRYEEFIPGITSPQVDEYGGIGHTTGSGRLTWDVVTDLSLALRVWEEVMLDPLLQGSHGEEWAGEVYAAFDSLRVDEAAYLLREADWVEEEAHRLRVAAADLMTPLRTLD